MPRPSPQTDRVIATINLLAATEAGATLTEIARAVGQEPSTCQHMLAALTTSGFLVREPSDRRYHLGPALVAPGQVAQRRYPLLAAARPEMEALSRRFGLACYAFAPDGQHARIVHVTVGPGADPLPIRIGETVPLLPPLGAAFIVWSGDDTIDAWLAAEPHLDAAGRKRYRNVLDQARSRGYVIEVLAEAHNEDVLHLLQDRASPWRDRKLLDRLTGHAALDLADVAPDDMATVGAPVLDESGSLELTINLVGFVHELTAAGIESVGEAVRAAAHRAARRVAATRATPTP